MRVGRRGAAGLLVLAAVVLLFSGLGGAAGSVDIDSVDMPSSAEPGDRVSVEVTVTNGMDRDADDLEVRVRGFDQLKERTLYGIDAGETVTVDVTLNVPSDADGTEDVRVDVQARDDDGTILSDDAVTRSIAVSDGDGTTTTGDVEITTVATPARVQAGKPMAVDVTVANNRGGATYVDVRMEAFGQTKVMEDVRIDGNRERTVTLNLTVPRDASGPADLYITADTGGERDVTTVTVQVATLSMTMQLSPKTAEVGEPVTVTGLMSAAGVEADLYVGGLYETTVISDETDHYSHTITLERPGTYRVTLRAGAVSVEKYLQVVGDVTVNAVSAPDRVARGTLFTVCSTVSRSTPGEVDATLLVDGDAVRSTSVAADDRTEVCFDTSLDAAGDHTVTVRAATGSAQDSRSRTVTAVESGITASVVPGKLTLQPGQAGVMRVDIGNDELRERTFTVSVSGLPNVTLDREHDVTLAAGASDTVVLRMVPQGQADRTGTVTVTTDGTTVLERTVDITVASNPAVRNQVTDTVQEWTGAAGDRFARLPQEQQWMVVGGIVAVLLVVGWMWRRRRHNVMTPQY